jgi:hypothetical protein
MQGLSQVFVLNPGRLSCAGTFHYLQKFEPLMKVIKEHKIPVLHLPELSSNLQFECDEKLISYRNLSNPQRRLSERQNIKKFLDEVDFLFDRVFREKINSPQGLLKITEEQEQYRENLQLPILAMSEELSRATK